uniref:Uncharacterized protein n=1 Tax=Chenopodium quinoa TaxID=63459 RepID=A0A803L1V1_CHEQI
MVRVNAEGERNENEVINLPLTDLGARRNHPLQRMPPLSLSRTSRLPRLSEQMDSSLGAPLAAVPLSFVPYQGFEGPTTSTSGDLHGHKRLWDGAEECFTILFSLVSLMHALINCSFDGIVLHEGNCGLDYGLLGISASRVVTKRNFMITPSTQRAPSLRSSQLDIVPPADYLSQKPWYKKRDPFYLLSPDEQSLAAAAEWRASNSEFVAATPASKPRLLSASDEELLKTSAEAEARQALAEELELEKANRKAEVQSLVNSCDNKDAELEIANSTLQELRAREAAQRKEIAQLKREAEKAKADLSAAIAQLEVRIFTREQYEEGYDNSFNVSRRLAFHVNPEINRDQVEEWAAVPNHPTVRTPHPAESVFLAWVAEVEAEEEREEVSRLIQQVSSLSFASKTINLSQLVLSYASSNSSGIAFGKRYDKKWVSRASRVRSSVWRVGGKHPGYTEKDYQEFLGEA